MTGSKETASNCIRGGLDWISEKISSLEELDQVVQESGAVIDPGDINKVCRGDAAGRGLVVDLC